MPPVILAAIVTIGQAIAAVWTAVGGWGFIAKLALNFAISALVGKKNKPKSGGGYSSEVSGRQLIVRSSIQARNILYGTAVTSGPLVYVTNSGANKEYIHLVVVLVGHEVQEIDSIFFNDTEIPTSYLDGSGNVTAGRFAGYARIHKYLGTPTQAADADLISESGGTWTANHRLQGVAYLYVRLKHSYDVYESGLPNIKARIRGKKLYDPRDGQTRWTDNPALCVRDYLASSYGLSASGGEIDDTVAAASANICDERVLVASYASYVTFDTTSDEMYLDKTELRYGTGNGVRFTTGGTLPSPLVAGATYYMVRFSPTVAKLATTPANARDHIFIDLTTAGSGTHQCVHYDQQRYTANGILSTEQTPRENMQTLLTAMAGALPWVQGKYEIHAGAYTTPTLDLNEDDLRDTIQVQARTPRKDLYNAIKGVYVEPSKYWQPTDFAPVTNATYETQDGGVQIARDIELVFTDNQIAAQRIGKIHLEKSRQGITVTMPAKLRAIKTKAWATVTLTIAQLGWDHKVFRVINWSIASSGGINLVLQEESSTSYDWASGEATIYDAAPDTNLLSGIDVIAPTSLVLDSGSDQAFVNTDGTVIVRVFATWTLSADAFVTNYDFQWKKSTDTTWQSKVLTPATSTAYIEPAIEGVTYDVRIRAVNGYGATSAFLTGSVAATGKNTPPGDPSSLASATVPGGIKLTWTNPVDPDLNSIEIWEATTNDRSMAAKIAEISANFFTRTGPAGGTVLYYWIRAVDTTGNLSGFNPAGATSGVSGTVGGGAAVAYSDITGTKPPVDADNTNSAISAGETVTSGGITFSAGGAIKGGATNFLTGTGWFLGYSSGAYKFSIGDPVGSYMSWDGANLTVRGNIINNITYTAGGTLLSDLTQVSNIYVGQYDTNTVKTWACTANGSITVNIDIAYASGFTPVALRCSIKKNGVIQGATYSLVEVTPTFYTLSRTFNAAIGDTITVVVATPTSPTYCNVKNFTATIASVNVIAASQSSFNNVGSTYVLAKKIQLPSGGVIQVLFDLWCSSGAAYGRIYKNGVAVGTERTTTSTTPVSWTENITFAANDTIELWIKSSGTNSTYTQRFELAVNQALTVPVTLK